MRLLSAGLCTMVAAALLAGCSGGSGSSPSSSMPGGAGVTPPTVKSAHGKIALTTIPKYLFEKAKHRNIEAPEALTRGLATAEFLASTGNIIVYPKNNSANGPPRCNITTGQGVNDFASDEKGDFDTPTPSRAWTCMRHASSRNRAEGCSEPSRTHSARQPTPPPRMRRKEPSS